MTKHNMHIFQGKPLFQATKQHLNSEKLDVVYLSAFGWAVLSCVLVSSVWKCWHDVMK